MAIYILDPFIADLLKPSKFVVVKTPSIYGGRFSTPYEVVHECDDLEDVKDHWRSLIKESKFLEYRFCTRKEYEKWQRHHLRLVEKNRQARIKFIGEAREKLANCSAAVYKMTKRNKSNCGIYLSTAKWW